MCLRTVCLCVPLRKFRTFDPFILASVELLMAHFAAWQVSAGLFWRGGRSIHRLIVVTCFTVCSLASFSGTVLARGSFHSQDNSSNVFYSMQPGKFQRDCFDVLVVPFTG